MQTLLTHSLLGYPMKQWNPDPGASKYWVFKLKLRANVKGASISFFKYVTVTEWVNKIDSRQCKYIKK